MAAAHGSLNEVSRAQRQNPNQPGRSPKSRNLPPIHSIIPNQQRNNLNRNQKPLPRPPKNPQRLRHRF